MKSIVIPAPSLPVAGAWAYWDAPYTPSVTESGGKAAAIADLSGNGRDLSTDVGFGPLPLYTAGGPLVFDPAPALDDCVIGFVPGSSVGFGTGTDHTLFIVGRGFPSNSAYFFGDSARLLAAGDNSAPYNEGELVYDTGFGSDAVWTPSPATLAAKHIIEVVRAGTNVELFLNGVSQGAEVLAANDVIDFWYLAGKQAFEGFAYAFYDSTLSAPSRTLVREYLATRHGVTL